MLTKKEQKWVKSLKIKKYRQREGFFLIEGNKNVKELLNSSFKIEFLLGTEHYFEENLAKYNGRKETVSKEILGQLSHFTTNESVLAIAKIPSNLNLSTSLSKTHFILDGVSDPGNFGTIIRTMDWFGFDSIICSKNCTDFYQPKVIASSMGSFCRVIPYYVNLEEYIKNLKIPVLGADMNGIPLSKSTNFHKNVAIVMGSESHGISDNIRQSIMEYISIPNFGNAESLNVSIATSIIAAYLRIS